MYVSEGMQKFYILDKSLNFTCFRDIVGIRGIFDDIPHSPFLLFVTAKFGTVHSLALSSQLFFCLPSCLLNLRPGELSLRPGKRKTCLLNLNFLFCSEKPFKWANCLTTSIADLLCGNSNSVKDVKILR